MSIYTLIFIITIILTVIIFIPDIFPYCANCRKIKFRSSFKIHKAVGIKLGYSSNKSVCRKCCQMYDISSFREYERLEKTRKKIKVHLDSGKYI